MLGGPPFGGPPDGFLPCKFGGWGRGKENERGKTACSSSCERCGVSESARQRRRRSTHTHTHTRTFGALPGGLLPEGLPAGGLPVGGLPFCTREKDSGEARMRGGGGERLKSVCASIPASFHAHTHLLRRAAWRRSRWWRTRWRRSRFTLQVSGRGRRRERGRRDSKHAVSLRVRFIVCACVCVPAVFASEHATHLRRRLSRRR